MHTCSGGTGVVGCDTLARRWWLYGNGRIIADYSAGIVVTSSTSPRSDGKVLRLSPSPQSMAATWAPNKKSYQRKEVPRGTRARLICRCFVVPKAISLVSYAWCE